jgi:hypothetical protein
MPQAQEFIVENNDKTFVVPYNMRMIVRPLDVKTRAEFSGITSFGTAVGLRTATFYNPGHLPPNNTTQIMSVRSIGGPTAVEIGNWDAPVFVGAWSSKPSAASAGLGAEMICTNYGTLNNRSFWISDGSLWRPKFRQLIYRNEVQSDGALISTEQYLKNFSVPADMLRGAFDWRIVGVFIKSAAAVAPSQFAIRLGPLGTVADPAYVGGTNEFLATSRQFALPAMGRYSAAPVGHGPVIVSNQYDYESAGMMNGATTPAPTAITGADGTGNLFFGFSITLATELPGVSAAYLWVS